MVTRMKRVGILALQGDFAAHEAVLRRVRAIPLLIREACQFDEIDGLIIPGGESTSMLKLIHCENMMEALAAFVQKKPVLGTCAGAILLAKTVIHPAQESLGAMDMVVERNAYGRQNESCIAEIETTPDFKTRIGKSKLEAVFIRAPIIRSVGPQVKVLARYNKDPVLVEQGRHMAATFHPELTASESIHAFFIAKL
jgi:pyridoxal 5'-phosphate synthase pdxT subunit